MKKITFALILLTGFSNAITVNECKELSQVINSTSDSTIMMNAMSKYASSDCDSRIGESTREKRVQEIRDAFSVYNKKD